MKKNNFEKYFKKYSYDINKIVGINPFNFDEIYLLEDRKISKITSKDIKDEYLISSYIPNKNVITYEFKIQKNLLDKIELYDYVETKCYEEVGLDEAEEYIFKYKIRESATDTKNVLIEVLIVSKKQLEEYYSPIKEKYGYLDYLTYPGFAFSVLYQEKVLEPLNDLFIYFTKDDIFITLYSEGKFLQTLMIPEGLENIYDELRESIKIKDFSFELFMQLLIKKGLDLNNYSEKEHILFNELSELFSNKFLIISNQLHTIIRKFALTTIDRIFMGTPKGVIPGISEFANMYLGVEANDLKFDLDYNPDNIEIDQVLFLSMFYASSAYKNNIQEDNFTIYYRPPTFFYRKSGQFISISIASLILSFSFPLYQMVNSYFIEKKNEELNQKLIRLKKETKNLNSTKSQIEKQFKSKKNQKLILQNYINHKVNLIYNVYKEKTKSIPISILLTQIAKYAYENNVYLIGNIEYGNLDMKLEEEKCIYLNNGEINCDFKNNRASKGILLNVVAISDKNITNFVSDLVNKLHKAVFTPGYSKTSFENYYKLKDYNLISTKPLKYKELDSITKYQLNNEIEKLKSKGCNILSIDKKIYSKDLINAKISYFDSQTVVLPNNISYSGKVIIKVEE